MEKNDKRKRNIEQCMTDLPGPLEGAVLERVRFGRSENTSFWVQGTRLRELCQYVKTRGEMDWLENLSCAQVDQNLLLTYFLRSNTTNESVILRISLELPSNHLAFVDVDSVDQIWEAAGIFEAEISMFFGVKFRGRKEESRSLEQRWDGFPLRKDFIMNAQEGLT